MKLLRNIVFAFFSVAMFLNISSAGSSKDFAAACTAYNGGNFEAARQMFDGKTKASPSHGAFQNLGNSEWQLGNTAQAIIAWERALLLKPFDANSENNLRFARETAQLESPELTWCEIAAAWLTSDAWAGIACGSFWFAIAMMILPAVLRWRKSAIQQAAVALGLGLFLLSLPANYGVWTRTQIGFAMQNETALKLTPTKEGEAITRLSAGEPGRVLRERGDHLLIRTRRMTGWIERGNFEFVTPR
jgi:tetratricopeptide (TPR) repeat protein